MNLKYYMPTKVFMGEDCINQNKEIFKNIGRKAMIVTGRNSAKKNGSGEDVTKALTSLNMEYVIYDKILSNPTVISTYEGARIAKQNNVDFIIAIGGGSPMDAGKAIALLAAQDIKSEELFLGNYEDKILPLVLIPTTSGTGSEVTQYSILTNEKEETKTSIATELLFPVVTFLDAKYTLDLGLITTINTAVDALSHSVEGMLSVKSSSITDALAKESIQTILSILTKIHNQKENKTQDDKLNEILTFHDREELLYASCMAGMVIAQTGTTIVHGMGYSLTFFQDVDHGKANGLLLCEYMRLVESKEPNLVYKILNAMGYSQIEQLEKLLDSLLESKVELSEDEIILYSEKAFKTKNLNNCIVKPNVEEIKSMYNKSLTNLNVQKT